MMAYFNNQSYQTYLKSLNLSEQLLFEMSCGVAAETISHMILTYKHFSQPKFRNQVLFLRLEDFRANFNRTIMSIAKHFDVKLSRRHELLKVAQQLSYGAFVSNSNHSSLSNVNQQMKSAVIQSLSNRNSYEFQAYMDCVHFSYFDHIFGLDSLTLLPYVDSYQIIRMTMNKSCLPIHSQQLPLLMPSDSSHYYEPHSDCVCYDISGLKYNFKGCNYSEFDVDWMWDTYRRKYGKNPSQKIKKWWK